MIDADAMALRAGEAAQLLKQLANEKRLMILCALVQGEQSVGALNASVALSQSALSQHLARLREAGLVTPRRDGQLIYYALAGDEAPAILHVL
ncbi:MAG: metalloregulator ArsR/SmtB family transcription factor, partial [Haliea sp.]